MICHDVNDKEKKKTKSRRQPTDAESDLQERENGETETTWSDSAGWLKASIKLIRLRDAHREG